MSDMRGNIDGLESGKHGGLGGLEGAPSVKSIGLSCRDKPAGVEEKCGASPHQSGQSGRGQTE